MRSGGAGREWMEESAGKRAAGVAFRVCARPEWSGLGDESRRLRKRRLRRPRLQRAPQARTEQERRSGARNRPRYLPISGFGPRCRPGPHVGRQARRSRCMSGMELDQIERVPGSTVG